MLALLLLAPAAAWGECRDSSWSSCHVLEGHGLEAGMVSAYTPGFDVGETTLYGAALGLEAGYRVGRAGFAIEYTALLGQAIDDRFSTVHRLGVTGRWLIHSQATSRLMRPGLYVEAGASREIFTGDLSGLDRTDVMFGLAAQQTFVIAGSYVIMYAGVRAVVAEAVETKNDPGGLGYSLFGTFGCRFHMKGFP